MENRDFRISDACRQNLSYFNPIFETSDNLIKLHSQAQEICQIYNKIHNENRVRTAKVNTCAVLHIVYQNATNIYIQNSDYDPFSRISILAGKNQDCADVLSFFNKEFPSQLSDKSDNEETLRAFFMYQVFCANPAILNAMQDMLNTDNPFPQGTKALKTMLGAFLESNEMTVSSEKDLFTFLTYPSRLFPNSLENQIKYILQNWEMYLPEELRLLLLRSLDYMSEEDTQHGFGLPGEIPVPDYSGESDFESFTEDRNWMPNVVMMAKSTLVWLDQLSKQYKADIHRLDQIPDCELDKLKDAGFTALWLIGLWERSPASKTIKQLCGNKDAESSAYSLQGYSISSRIGGWEALNNLKTRCWERGIRLASDMVPNHTGLDSQWLFEHPEYFVQQSYPPFVSYTYNGPDLSPNPDIEIKIEDHYYSKTDAAVTFRTRDKQTGRTSYIFHGNDGTTMPWNDTAQLDFLNPQTREAVINQIVEVAKSFPIIRFDAAMTLAKRHIQRLWYPNPGKGGDIPGRSEHGLSNEEFNRRIPNEFWREVVDRIQSQAPDTLLLAEAFWMMESYFVRTLGMHRVYNSAFMHMMKNEDNQKYRDTIKSTLTFDPEILKRYVNFMNNPDEETAIAQFGNGDKYFGVCTLLATMPGLPMFGHGQLEGFREKYGMEYQRAYWDEIPDTDLLEKHKQKIFPILKMRKLFSGCRYFNMFDVIDNFEVQQSVFAYTNGDASNVTLVLYNNRWEETKGTIFNSVPKLNKETRELETVNLGQALRLSMSSRRFMIYKDINDGLTYLVPSMKICDEGLFVSLKGYETHVFTDIHEREDIDGVYQKLYERLQGNGVKDLDREIRLLYLEPFFEAALALKSQKFFKEVKTLITGKNNSSNLRDIMSSLGTYYTYIEELEELFIKIGLKHHAVKPAKILKTLNLIDQVCKSSVFKNGCLIIQDHLIPIMAASFMILPFTEAECSINEAFSIVEKLMLDTLFNENIYEIGKCSIIVSTDVKEIEKLLENNLFKAFIGVNEYENILWYRGESFQECMFMNFLSRAFQNEKISEEQNKKDIEKWLKINIHAEYRFNNLTETK